MATNAELNFVQQQGFPEASAQDCDLRYPALMWQPRLSGVGAIIGLITQQWLVFLGLAVLLWWTVFAPRGNPLDAVYNRWIAARRGLPPIPPAPAPRRFAQAIAGTFALAIAVSLRLSWMVAAYALEGFLLLALGALIFGHFCLGSYIYHLATGNRRFANRTLPWSRAGEAR